MCHVSLCSSREIDSFTAFHFDMSVGELTDYEVLPEFVWQCQLSALGVIGAHVKL